MTLCIFTDFCISEAETITLSLQPSPGSGWEVLNQAYFDTFNINLL